MIIVTGGAGFLGSAFLWKLNEAGLDDILVVDALGKSDKWKNLVNRRFTDYMHKDDFLRRIESDSVPVPITAIVHMGACSSTTERDADYLAANNYRYTVTLAEWAVRRSIRFLYASSGATYGDGGQGYSDDHAGIRNLKPLNMYGYSKQMFDLHALRSGLGDKLVGVKFFNVFGPNEYHKGEMSSVIFKAFHQIDETGRIRLFKSYRNDYGDGEQVRDFIYVKDAMDVLWWMLEEKNLSGIFNLGTGKARSWNDLGKAVFSAMGFPPNIEYIEMPSELRDRYQYHTQADMRKLRHAGYTKKFTELEDGVRDYVVNYLKKPDPYL